MPYFIISRLAPSWSENRTKQTHNKKQLREQFNPNNDLRKIHKFAINAIQQQLPSISTTFASATGFVKRGGINRHFQRHVNQMGYFNQYWFVTDISKAYASVKTDILNEILLNLFWKNPNPYEQGSEDWYLLEELLRTMPFKRYSQFSKMDLKTYLEDFFLNPRTKQGLAEGFPSSPLLFNLYAEIVLDKSLRIWCEEQEVTYSRFADDLIFSSDKPIGRVKRKDIKKIIAGFFSINQSKTHYFDIDRFPQGVVLNKTIVRNRNGQAETSMTGNKQREFKRMLYQAHYYPENANLESLSGKFGSLLQKTNFFGRTFPDTSRITKELLQMFRGYTTILKEGAGT